MAELDINAEIAEPIMGWIVDRGRRQYCDPLDGSGAWEWLPDFHFVKRDYDAFLEKMKSLGYTLTESETPPDLKKEAGFCCTACFTRAGGKLSGHPQRPPARRLPRRSRRLSIASP